MMTEITAMFQEDDTDKYNEESLVVLFKESDADYSMLLVENGFTPIFVPTLEFEFCNLDMLAEKTSQPADYDGIIFTSPRGVDAVIKCFESGTFNILDWQDKHIYTVGDQTATKIKKSLQLSAKGFTSGSATNLAKFIIEEKTSQNLKFLFPCGNLSSEVLPDLLKGAGYGLDALTVYETKENTLLQKNLLDITSRDEILGVVFFSPSGVSFVQRTLESIDKLEFFNSCSLIAIGYSTAERIENLNWNVSVVAATPTPKGVLDALQSIAL